MIRKLLGIIGILVFVFAIVEANWAQEKSSRPDYLREVEQAAKEKPEKVSKQVASIEELKKDIRVLNE